MGVDTVLFTLSLDAVANMPCNPSIGGTAKGHLVFEIDALGGEMGRAADLVTLQSRTLNTGKGAAVQSKRVQADRKQYQRLMKHTLETTPHLRLVQAEIVALRTETDEEGRQICRRTGNPPRRSLELPRQPSLQRELTLKERFSSEMSAMTQGLTGCCPPKVCPRLY